MRSRPAQGKNWLSASMGYLSRYATRLSRQELILAFLSAAAAGAIFSNLRIEIAVIFLFVAIVPWFLSRALSKDVGVCVVAYSTVLRSSTRKAVKAKIDKDTRAWSPIEVILQSYGGSAALNGTGRDPILPISDLLESTASVAMQQTVGRGRMAVIVRSSDRPAFAFGERLRRVVPFGDIEIWVQRPSSRPSADEFETLGIVSEYECQTVFENTETKNTARSQENHVPLGSQVLLVLNRYRTPESHRKDFDHFVDQSTDWVAKGAAKYLAGQTTVEVSILESEDQTDVLRLAALLRGKVLDAQAALLRRQALYAQPARFPWVCSVARKKPPQVHLALRTGPEVAFVLGYLLADLSLSILGYSEEDGWYVPLNER